MKTASINSAGPTNADQPDSKRSTKRFGLSGLDEITRAAVVMQYLVEEPHLRDTKKGRELFKQALRTIRGTPWEAVLLPTTPTIDEARELKSVYRGLHEAAGFEENLALIDKGAWRENEDARRIAEIHGELQYANAEERMELLKELHACHRRFAEARKINLSDGDVIDRQTKTVVNGGVTDGEKETK